MAKVIQAFRERFENMKLYKPGDEYSYDDKERVQYLISQGFLEQVDEPNPGEPPTLEEFLSMSASEQKGILFRLAIEGDDSNSEKREALYKQFLGIEDDASTQPESPEGVSENADSDA